jgi:RimJ/RimL family protein N-acetyltransferase
MYKCLRQNNFIDGLYSIVPIRNEDRYQIKKWRNEQMFHLRQNKILTDEDQDSYFNNIIKPSFSQQYPSQILFSFLDNGMLIGYGGLVHINWDDKIAEVSLLMNTYLEENYFSSNWSQFLKLLSMVAFDNLGFIKIFTYAFDLRPKLYAVLENFEFKREAVLKNHVAFEGRYIDVIIHSKFNKSPFLKRVNFSDSRLLFKWATDPIIRKYSKNQSEITWDNHNKWLEQKITNTSCLFFLLMVEQKAVGSIRFEKVNDLEIIISYQIAPEFHGKGYGNLILRLGISQVISYFQVPLCFKGWVLIENEPSKKIFQKLGFEQINEIDNVILFQKNINEN